ncbi:sensor domain-containing diguanylate cyclase [Pelagibacterium xiamenense]|uniref:sensor domain-containing diguanylate cyclase n=1 Tax=Pelagibacterium xiamenense TaxID=2901140 RepID=UPI001E409B53|nr:sensor domain-containing diguanylate cyclase [Pelagibacterium xiamenense]MCD7059387.1 diguanylate cyclase [Pelagibacterium xiamenense]
MLRKIVDAAAVGMMVCAMDGTIVYRNRAFVRDFGADVRLATELFEGEGAQLLEQLKDVLAGHRDEYVGEHRCLSATGAPIWVSAAVSVLPSQHTGDPLYLVVQLSDIDRRKRAEKALAESESRWQFALESARQGVWDHDARTRSMFYSPMWKKLRGFAPDEVVDDSRDAWLARVHPDDQKRLLERVDRQNVGEDGYDILEYRERHRDGHYVWILSRGKPVEWDADGNVVRTIGTDTDISHLKAVEADLAHAATHDSLTDLLNRRAFNRALEDVPEDGQHCLLFVDLDNFKPVNDDFGHAEGDRALIAVATVIRGAIRKTDCAARIGGDEFTVLLRDQDLASGQAVAARLKAAIAQIAIGPEPAKRTLSASIGVSEFDSECSVDAIYARADADCYRAKKAGKAR